VATLEGAHGKGSLAVVRREDSGTVGVYAPGDAVASGARVHSVGRGIVHLRHGQQIEFLRFERPQRKRQRPSPSKPQRRYKWEVPGAEEAISCRNHHCQVDRAFVDELLASPSSLTRQARARFVREDGEIEGVRLYGIRRRSLPWMLGLRSGDVVLAVGGEPLDSTDDALRMYRSLRSAGEVELRVRRRDDVMVKVFDIS
jgi:type II secretory pathway component PulC